jgi:hypothetical protein
MKFPAALLILFSFHFTKPSNLTRNDVQTDLSILHRSLKLKQTYSSNLRTFFLCQTPPSSRTIPPDPGCTSPTPARCPNTPYSQAPICRPTYTHCPSNSGCVSPKNPFRCITGQCVSHISYCVLPETNFSQNFERCFDGVYRFKGTCDCLGYSGCRFNEFQCPDGTCGKSLMECAGAGGCPMGRPYLCADLSCVGDVERCPVRTTDEAFPMKSLQFLGVVKADFRSGRKVVLDSGDG